MKNKITISLIFCLGIISGVFLRHNQTSWSLVKKPFKDLFIKDLNSWDENFYVANIESSIDGNVQKAYCYKSNSYNPRPLIVSLHTWGGDYEQFDDLSEICKQKNLNYIHPDFRGPNRTIEACCSDLALNDIDDAISYALKHMNVDPSRIFVVGVSGGGYATLSMFMKSRHDIRKFSAWAPITDLISRYNQSVIMEDDLSKDILVCTNSGGEFNIENAKLRSPLYWDTPLTKLNDSKVSIYAGVFDGIRKHVPITHSINFYNKILNDLSVSDTSVYITNYEKLKLLEHRKPLGEYGQIGDRKIFLKKTFGNLSLVIFDGNHEILPEFALNDLINE